MLDYCYVLRVPTASTIYPRATVEESISALDNVNRSLPYDKSLPEEIRLLINKQVHANPTYEKVHSTWTPLTYRHKFTGDNPDEGLKYDKVKKSFYLTPEYYLTWRERGEGTKIGLDKVASAADVLYRLRCYFPNVYTEATDGYKCIWSTGVRHNQTGLILILTEDKGNPSVYVIRNENSIDFSEAETMFTANVIELLNMLFETVEGSHRFAYYHPAADADFPTPNEHFPAVPAESLKNRVQSMDIITDRAFNSWKSAAIAPADISSFKSILPSLMYDIESGEVDPVNGTANLTTIISSSLLFYRLLCHFPGSNSNINNEPPITSVWQVKLQHRVNGASILFMDDRGLFDIRVSGEEKAKELMDVIVGLVNALCSDECYHPYDGLVAGCGANPL
ncbi:hypothetical protein Clacol_000094 [Clathrus columnatus]|uniref:Choline/carnitine acyltransferase domain-containing protein n=1 Tax=Clathrus columnatus TaxID=1419009 RepID=A0AAV4ZY14_9AGAM|nr:hypothetical protein Clacol_000094 [Clathrus columnatus]